MSLLDTFGFVTIVISLVCYHYEERWPTGLTLGFAITCAMGSVYGFKKDAFPFGIVEIFWALAALKKFILLKRAQNRITKPTATPMGYRFRTAHLDNDVEIELQRPAATSPHVRAQREA